mmetsp:Transcript_80124/g.226820  ORF Transcript_80124/g.226820 Transcript_80124/m.226820 type:complete len:217 (+) Transcript_80124:363-1013(+)
MRRPSKDLDVPRVCRCRRGPVLRVPRSSCCRSRRPLRAARAGFADRLVRQGALLPDRAVRGAGPQPESEYQGRHGKGHIAWHAIARDVRHPRRGARAGRRRAGAEESHSGRPVSGGLLRACVDLLRAGPPPRPPVQRGLPRPRGRGGRGQRDAVPAVRDPPHAEGLPPGLLQRLRAGGRHGAEPARPLQEAQGRDRAQLQAGAVVRANPLGRRRDA